MDTADLILQSADNPKLQKSRFIQFIKRIRAGEITIENNQVVELEPRDMAESSAAGMSSWAEQFAASAVDGAIPASAFTDEHAWLPDDDPPSPSETSWAREFTGDKQAESSTRAEGSWAAEYLKESNLDTVDEGVATLAPGQSMKDWVEQYRENIQHLKDPEDDWEELEKDWEKFEARGLGYEGYFEERTREYAFREDNPYLNDPTASQLAVEFLSQGQLAEAILALESELQQRPSNAAAWFQLGLCQAKNEQDLRALAALRKATSLDPTNLDAWIALAVSYANENARTEACDALLAWLRNHPEYARLSEADSQPSVNRLQVARAEFDALYGRLIREGGPVDADLECVLGTLRSIENDYQAARSHFERAVALRPHDYMLLNKLGASHANAGHPEDAVRVYREALELNPGYVRVRYNLAISCNHLQAHTEAADHLLSALALQQTSSSAATPQMSDSIWDALKLTCYMMQQPQLAAYCEARDLEAFKQHFKH